MNKQRMSLTTFLIAAACIAGILLASMWVSDRLIQSRQIETDRVVNITWGSFQPEADDPYRWTRWHPWRWLTGYWRYFETDRVRVITWGGEA